MSGPRPKLFQRWSAEEVATFRRVYPEGGIAGVMAATGRGRGSVLWKLGELRCRRSCFWTAEQDDFLRRSYGKLPTAEIAAQVRHAKSGVRQRARKLGLDFGRYYTPEDIAVLRAMYADHTADEIVAAIGGSKSGIYQLTKRLGLRKWRDRKYLYGPVRAMHAQGLNDHEIARALGLARDVVHAIRYERLRLPVNAAGVRRAHLRAVASQQRSLGIANPAELRARSFRRFAVANGWPADLLPREVQILNVLAVRGPQTALELARRLGMATDRRNSVTGCRRLLASCNRPGAQGTYTGSLIQRGLVHALKRYARGRPKGKAQLPNLYTLTAAAVALIEERTQRAHQQLTETA